MRTLGVTVGLALSAAACSGTESSPPSTQRPAAKSTCPEAQITAELPALDRQLIPFSDTVLGVETTYGGDEQLVRLVSGGYLDDLFESFDDLEAIGTTTIRASEATLLETDFLGSTVQVAVWREPDVEPPCDAHALITLGYDEADFARIHESIE